VGQASDANKNTRKEPNERIDWSRAIQTLISEGHRIEDIKGYTMNQISTFYETIHKQRIDKLKMDTIAQTIAFSGDSQNVKTFLTSLDNEPRPVMKIERT
jgi:hypothetical protein